jgi:hypothetical protein
MARRWFGRRAYFNINPGSPGSDSFQMFASFDNPTFHDGDSLLRILFGWQAQTELTDFGGVPDRGPWPMFVTVAWEPDPDGDTEISAPPIGGAGLWRESVAWQRVHFTDGATTSFAWEAHSGQPRSGAGQRKTIDKTISQLVCTASFDNSAADDFPADTFYVPLNVRGNMWLEYLVEQ